MQEHKNTKIYLSLPVLDEIEALPVVVECIRKQSYSNFVLYACVNQPDAWWQIEDKMQVCLNNMKAMEFLKDITDFNVKIIDNCSEGKGWKADKLGVGWARKTIMDEISKNASADDIILSLDADLSFEENYFQSVVDNLYCHPDASALSVPYYHRLTGKDDADRAVLRYEIYMRNYALNLLYTGNPYSFTALGSAMALPVNAYRKIGGMSPKKSGEDFYFLQQLRKTGEVIQWNKEKVYPTARFSDRVFFGTGPAMIKGNTGDWTSYPVYHYSLFLKIKETCDLFPVLFSEDIETPMSDFLYEQFRTTDIWQPLRNNFKTRWHFIKACHEKIDGLRILQFLKSEQKKINITDEQCLNDNFAFIIPDRQKLISEMLSVAETLSKLSVQQLNTIRNILAEEEEKYRLTLYQNIKTNNRQ